MKMMEIKELTRDEVELQLADAREELYNLRFQHAMHQLENPLKLREVRRSIARLLTVLKEFDFGVRGESRAEEKEG